MKGFTFDDVVLVPKYSSVERGEVDIDTPFYDYTLSVPVLSSPMGTITNVGMMEAMYKHGGLGVHHRDTDTENLMRANTYPGIIAVCPSMGIDAVEKIYKAREVYYNSFENTIFAIDVAHGHTERNIEFAKQLVNMGADVISGNIVTPGAAEDYLNVGVRALRIGIGSGSVCTTRVVTGVGMPQLAAIRGIYKLVLDAPGITLISDGGHRTTGDIVKALAFGANLVMLGGMLSRTMEAAGGGIYSGMASEEALSRRKEEFFVEGVTKVVVPDTTVKEVLGNIKKAIETACYYLGARGIIELRQGEYMLVSQNGYMEGLAK